MVMTTPFTSRPERIQISCLNFKISLYRRGLRENDIFLFAFEYNKLALNSDTSIAFYLTSHYSDIFLRTNQPIIFGLCCHLKNKTKKVRLRCYHISHRYEMWINIFKV